MRQVKSIDKVWYACVCGWLLGVVWLAGQPGAVIAWPQAAPLEILPVHLPAATSGSLYSAQLLASGGMPPHTWTVVRGRGHLPHGLTLDSRGRISGTPSGWGMFAFRVEVRDTAVVPQRATQDLVLEVATSTLHGAPVTARPAIAIWYADFETGSISQWYLPAPGKQGDYGGDEERSGLAESVVSKEQAHGGSLALKMTITAPPQSGTRLFRWREPKDYPKLYYTVWYYFPQRYAVLNWWNVFQWKSKRSFSQVDPFFVLNVGNRPDGSMYFYLYDWQTKESFTQAVKDIPVGRWFSVSAFYACAGDETGRVTFWQEDTPLFDLRQVRTRYPDGDCQWSVGPYADGVNPSPVTIFIDDAVISLPATL